MSVGDDEVAAPDGAVREPGDGEGSDAAGPGPTREGHLTPDDLDALGDEIAQLAGQIAAATARFLTLLGRFDEQGGWAGPGIRSLAHWLSWRAGMSLRTARDHVRVARSLRSLPQTAQAFGNHDRNVVGGLNHQGADGLADRDGVAAAAA